MEGQDLKAALKSVDWTQKEFGELVGHSETAVSGWVVGRHPVPEWVAVMVALLRDVPEARAYLKARHQGRQS